MHRNSGLIQIVLDFFLIMVDEHRIHGCEEHGLPVSCETFFSKDQSTLDDGMHVVSVPDVVDVLGEVIG